MRVLVTGHRGFAGRHVVSHLRATTDWEVVVIEGDLRYPLRTGDIDAVLHLASGSSVATALADPVPFVQNNVDLTLNLLQWARTQALRHFVQVSTNEVYGPMTAASQRPVETTPLNPSTPYSASKVAQEALAMAWRHSYGVPAIVANTMHLFGEHQPDDRFVPTATRALLRGEPVRIYGSADAVPSRCWLYAGDHADALRWLISHDHGEVYPCQPGPGRWNIAGPEFDCVEVVQKIADLVETQARIEFEPNGIRPGHEQRYGLDTTKIAVAGWQAPIGFDEGLVRTVRWIYDNDTWRA